jgi:hypothetical protein
VTCSLMGSLPISLSPPLSSLLSAVALLPAALAGPLSPLPCSPPALGLSSAWRLANPFSHTLNHPISSTHRLILSRQSLVHRHPPRRSLALTLTPSHSLSPPRSLSPSRHLQALPSRSFALLRLSPSPGVVSTRSNPFVCPRRCSLAFGRCLFSVYFQWYVIFDGR